MKIGICIICGKIATQTCQSCGSIICIGCISNGICKLCVGGKKVETPLKELPGEPY